MFWGEGRAYERKAFFHGLSIYIYSDDTNIKVKVNMLDTI